MKPLCAREIVGTWATLLLPIQDDQSIDFTRLTEEIDYQLSCGVAGIYSNGTAGEFHTQTEDEFDRISELLAERCEAAQMPFQIGASHMSPQISLHRVRRAVQLRPSAIQVILSDWVPLTDEEAVACLQRLAEAAEPVGLVLYNPPHAKRVLKPAAFLRLAEAVPALVGIKVLHGDQAWYAEMRDVLARLSVFVPGHQLATGYSQGAHGAYSNAACLHPRGAQRWYEQIRTDLDAALELERRLVQFIREHIFPWQTEHGYSNTALDKLLAAVGDWSKVGTHLRWPYRSIPAEVADQLRPIARSMLPEFFRDNCERP